MIQKGELAGALGQLDSQQRFLESWESQGAQSPRCELGDNSGSQGELGVRNGFSNPTKEQIGQDQCRKDIMNDCQEKALKEGCCENKLRWMCLQ